MKEHLKGYSEFQYYRDNHLWYRTDETMFLFPVPVSDIGEATFNKTEKSLLMMRYIRKYVDDIIAGVV